MIKERQDQIVILHCTNNLTKNLKNNLTPIDKVYSQKIVLIMVRFRTNQRKFKISACLKIYNTVRTNHLVLLIVIEHITTKNQFRGKNHSF